MGSLLVQPVYLSLGQCCAGSIILVDKEGSGQYFHVGHGIINFPAMEKPWLGLE